MIIFTLFFGNYFHFILCNSYRFNTKKRCSKMIALTLLLSQLSKLLSICIILIYCFTLTQYFLKDLSLFNTIKRSLFCTFLHLMKICLKFQNGNI